MSTLTDLIAEKLGCDVDFYPDASPDCSQPYYCQTHEYDSTSEVCSLVKDVAAVVADWLESDEAKASLVAALEAAAPTATAEDALAALAAEARKGADQ